MRQTLEMKTVRSAGAVVRNARIGSHQSRNVIIDARGVELVATQATDLLQTIVDNADSGPYLDNAAVLTRDGGVIWTRDG